MDISDCAEWNSLKLKRRNIFQLVLADFFLEKGVLALKCHLF